MQRNKILLSGLALGKDIGLCPVCNFDFDWLIKTHHHCFGWIKL